MRTTVVMPVYGNWPVVQRALAALRPELGSDRELVVVDDASPDDTADRVENEFANARLLRNEANEGFGPACNQGAAVATGEYLCFMNSDAIVTPGAIDTLERALDDDGENGAAVGQLVDENGALQEAGWAMGGDGVPYALGRGANPDDPRWAFRREVDYGSAACFLVRTAEFRELGGFDDAFAPGYYEDADLCARLEERGRRTVVEPAARIVHLQYGSGSRDRAKALVRCNRARFLARWSARFAHRPFVPVGGPSPHRELALRDAVSLIRFLVVENAGLAQEVASRWRGARVTLIDSGSAMAGSAVERAEPDDAASWLEERRFHYSAVLGEYAPLRAALRRSQPQAIEGPVDADADLVSALAAGGIAPPGWEPRG